MTAEKPPSTDSLDGRELLAGFIEKTTQAKFARAVNCSESHLSLILSGDRQPSLKLAKRIMVETGGTVPMDALIKPDAILNDGAEVAE